MKSQLVSIIIPFFNVEKYLERCLNSVGEQTYPRTEVVLIDDGSTDTSYEIAEQFCKKHPHTLLKRTTNGGPGNARNEGLELASGELVLFIDSDDHVANNLVEKMVAHMMTTNADIVMCGFELQNPVLGNGKIYERAWNLKSLCVTGHEAIEAMYGGALTLTVWGKLFKKKLIDTIKFPPTYIYEDRPFMLKAFHGSSKICFLREVLIYIQERENSLTRSPFSDRTLTDLMAVYNQEYDYMLTSGLQDAIPILNRYQLAWLRRSFFRIANLKNIENSELRSSFLRYLKDFGKKALPRQKPKDKIHYFLLSVPSLLGWRLARKVLKAIYSN